MYFGIELGGTKVVVAAGLSPETLSPLVRLPTTDPQNTIPAVIAALRDLEATHGPGRALGIASFGPIRLDPRARDYGTILDTPKLAWRDFNVLTPLRDAFPHMPIALDTDVNAAALAEARWGAGKGQDIFAYVTVGTGVGVGLYAHGRPLHGFLHPEAGHMLIRRTASEDIFAGICPFHRDCLEGMICGPSVEQRLGVKGEAVPDDHSVWGQIGGYLAQLFHNLTVLTAPQKIIVGGGVGLKHSVLDSAREAYIDLLGGYYRDIPDRAAAQRLIVPAALSDRAGVLGAIALAVSSDSKDIEADATQKETGTQAVFERQDG
ncbi:fructokinase [Novosphingobium sp. SG751A]|uniref:ROK family protein n=1 Tax=Novosphingobium sp. SG751A TaxID=2587000 RepID=UPI0015571B01|nr:ROK family protein [Novosphingobium sp. SG751A]NOW48647.1 fructokinase [Novosphingobium sp. SG751A]